MTRPVALWMVVQLIPLCLAAFRVRLSAHYPAAAETLALPMMVIVQTCAVALLAPVLLRWMPSTIAIALTAGPMLQLAGVLAQAPIDRVLAAWGYLIVLIIGLALWIGSLSRNRQMLVVAIASMLTLGGMIGTYLSAEFASSKRFWNPMEQWGVVVAILVSGAAAAWVSRRPKTTDT